MKTGMSRWGRGMGLVLGAMLFWGVVGHGEAQVVINEVMYHAPGDLEDLQFVELHNAGDKPVELAGWSFSKGIKFRFPEGSRVEAGGYWVLCRSEKLFRQHYPSVRVDGTFSSKIRRKGERLELRDGLGRVVDGVTFGDRYPWPTGADGESGSLERIAPGETGEEAWNWISSPLSEAHDKPAGTPGRQNAGYGAVMPPVILAVRGGVDFVAPGEGVNVEVEIRGEDLPRLKEVRLVYQLVGPGYQKAPVAKVLEKGVGGGDGFRGGIPGQEAGALVRYWVEAEGRSGGVRFFPARTEPRPSMSYYVWKTPEVAAVPQVWLIHTTEQEMKAAEDRVNAPVAGFGFGPPRVNPDEEARTSARKVMESQLDLSPLWFQMTVRASRMSGERVGVARAFLQQRVDMRKQLMTEILVGRGVEQRASRLPEMMAAYRESTFRAALEVLDEVDRPGLQRWWSERGDRVAKGERMILSRADLEGVWYVLTFLETPSMADWDKWQGVMRSLDVEREKLVMEVVSGQGKDTAFREQRNRAEEMGDRIGSGLGKVLTEVQRLGVERWQKTPREELVGLREPARRAEGGPGPFGMGGPFGAQEPVDPGTYQSAMVYWEGGSEKPRLFDHVNIKGRKGGFKVRFAEGKPLGTMTTLSLIFEGETSALVEPLAYEVYRKAGTPVEQSYPVRYVVNGKPAGYVVLIEQPNKAFLRRNGIHDGGSMYKLIWFGTDLVGQHEKHTRTHEGHEDLVQVVEGLNKLSGREQWEFIRKHFDVEQVATYFAVNMVLSHWDGFFNNYFAYHDSGGTGKWMMFPWDQDSTWGLRGGGPGESVFYDMALTFGMNGDEQPSRGGGSWRPPGWFSGPLLANPEFRKIFLGRTKYLLEHVYTEAVWEPVLADYERRLLGEAKAAAVVKGQDPEEAANRLRSDLARCREHVKKRREFLLGQAELRGVEGVAQPPR